MSTKRLSAFLLVLLLAFTGLSATASDDVPASTDINECYDGGVMEGKCNDDFDGDGTISPFEIDWAWTCGWYLAQYNRALIPVTLVPDWCSSLISFAPSIPPVSVPPCITYTDFAITYCMSGNMLSEDTGNDGSFEKHWYIMSDAIVGPSGLCPAGTTYRMDLISSISVSDFYAWLLSYGFSPYSDYCQLD